MQRAIYSGVIVAAGLWLLAVVAAPVAAAGDLPGASVLYAFFDPVCHQLPERSFQLGGYPLAVCHRCSGLYLGFFLGLLVVPVARGARRWLLEAPRRVLPFFVPLALDWAFFANTPSSRFLTGLLAAAPVATLVWAAVRQLSQPASEPVRGGEPCKTS